VKKKTRLNQEEKMNWTCNTYCGRGRKEGRKEQANRETTECSGRN